MPRASTIFHVTFSLKQSLCLPLYLSEKNKNLYTATFTLQFKHRGDVCYIAYHYPYTHSRLLADLTSWQLRAKEIDTPPTHSKLYFRVQNLTSTLLDNLVPLVTITEADNGSTDPGSKSWSRCRYFLLIRPISHSG